MSIEYVGSIVKGSITADGIHKLLVLCDDEFKPRLSARIYTGKPLSTQLGQNSENASLLMSIEPYFERILQQKNIVSIVDGTIVSFISFIPGFDKPNYFPDVFRTGNTMNYISTVCTHPDFRKQGYATRLYDFIEKSLPNDIQANCVATRTWHTNNENISILQKRGYRLTNTIPRERKCDDGTELDTVYYCKRIEG